MRDRRPERRGWFRILVIALGAATMCTPTKGTREGEARWTEVAALSTLVDRAVVEGAEGALARQMPAELRPRAQAVLAGMAATSPDAAGIRAAGRQLADALPGFVTAEAARGPAPSGRDDHRVAIVKRCALPLMHGLVARAGQAVRRDAQARAAATDLLAAIGELATFPEQMEDLLAEASLALGTELYLEVTPRRE
jgi:hypothetical protein